MSGPERQTSRRWRRWTPGMWVMRPTWENPAVLTTTSTGPVCSNSRCTESSSVTSTAAEVWGRPSSATLLCAPSALRSAMVTWSPSAASAWAVAQPIPDAPPITTALRWFPGRNVLPERTWETRSQVVVADPGREFAWEVNNGWVRWGYTFEPEGDGTRLTESWEFLPPGIAGFRERFGDEADAQIAGRRA